MPRPKRAASLQDPMVSAIVTGLYRFKTEAQAEAMLAKLAATYEISKAQEGQKGLKLWVRGYAITKEEEKQGFKGNYALLGPLYIKNARWTIVAEKLPTPLSEHPQRQRPQSRHPNLGHPILRMAVRKKPYRTLEHARNDLLRLHEEFPEATIPGIDMLHIMLYTSKEKPPIRKITLHIVPQANDTFLLEMRDKAPRKQNHPLMEKKLDAQGKFTAKLSLERKGRKKKPPINATKKLDNGAAAPS